MSTILKKKNMVWLPSVTMVVKVAWMFFKVFLEENMLLLCCHKVSQGGEVLYGMRDDMVVIVIVLVHRKCGS